MPEDRAATGRRVQVTVCVLFLCAWLAGAATARADACPDALITAAVKTRLAVDDVVGAFKINVDTDECVVTLHGCVGSRAQARRARSLAGKVGKVRAVKSQLKICPADKENR
ncbi:MAG: BON domain-containing protein [Acidobacteria bacterium]|nr:BON domain-containing protein [Acidobacteriota bacterium]